MVRLGLKSLIVALCASSAPAAAQVYFNPVDTVVPITYDRGRNVSVRERSRPEVDAIGVNLGGFTLRPSLDTEGGVTNNVYQVDSDRESDAFLRLAPRVYASSNWSRNSLQVEGTGDLLRYADKTPRNQNGWSLATRGRYDISSSVALNAGVDTARLYETQFSGAAVTAVRDITPYQRTQFRGLADARLARVRLVGVADYTEYDFRTVTTLAGTRLNQDNRDRSIARGAVQAEYGLTPDAGVFGQVTYTDTDYRTALFQNPNNRDSREIRALAGVSLDLTAVARGTFSIGYIDRDYRSATFRTVKGLSLEGNIEYFPTQLTTVTLNAVRDVQDATFGGSGFFNTALSLRLDHELLRNLLLNYGVQYANNDYIGVAGKADVYLVSGGADYLANRLLTGRLTATYARRTSDFTGVNGPRLSELRVLAGIIIHP